MPPGAPFAPRIARPAFLPIMALTSKQRAHLRRLAHGLKPVVLVGAEGVTDAVLASATEAFNTRELVKVKLLESAPTDIRTAAHRIAAGIDGAEAVHTIGRTAVLYRADPDAPEIELPGARG